MLCIWHHLIMPQITGKCDTDFLNRTSQHYKPIHQCWSMVQALSGAASHREKVVSACGNIFSCLQYFHKVGVMKKNVAESSVKRIQLCQCSEKKNTQQTDFENQAVLDRNRLRKTCVFCHMRYDWHCVGMKQPKLQILVFQKFSCGLWSTFTWWSWSQGHVECIKNCRNCIFWRNKFLPLYCVTSYIVQACNMWRESVRKFIFFLRS